MRFFINKKNKEFKKKMVNNLNNEEFKLDVVQNSKYINESYEDIFNLQLMESCISIDEEYDLLEHNNASKVDLYTI